MVLLLVLTFRNPPFIHLWQCILDGSGWLGISRSGNAKTFLYPALGRGWSSGARRCGAMTMGFGISKNSAFGRSKFQEPEKHKNLLRKPFVLSSSDVTFCIGTKQSHATRYIDCTRNEAACTSPWTPAPNWASFCASSSGGSKNKSLIWRRTLHEIASHSTCCTVILKPKKCWLRAGMTASSMTQPYHTLSLLGGLEFVDLNQSSVTFALTTTAWLSKRLLWWWQSSC